MTFPRFRTRSSSSSSSSSLFPLLSSTPPDSTQTIFFSETYDDPRAKAAATERSGDHVLIHTTVTEITPLRPWQQVTHTETEFGTYKVVSQCRQSSGSATSEDDDDLVERSDSHAKSSFWGRLSRSGRSSRKGSVDSVGSSVGSSGSGEMKRWLASLKPLFGFKNGEQESSERNMSNGVSVESQSYTDAEDTIENISDENRRVIEDVSLLIGTCYIDIICIVDRQQRLTAF